MPTAAGRGRSAVDARAERALPARCRAARCSALAAAGRERRIDSSGARRPSTISASAAGLESDALRQTRIRGRCTRTNAARPARRASSAVQPLSRDTVLAAFVGRGARARRDARPPGRGRRRRRDSRDDVRALLERHPPAATVPELRAAYTAPGGRGGADRGASGRAVALASPPPAHVTANPWRPSLSVAEDRTTLDELCVNTIRTLSMDAVQKANSGHPGTPMALAPLAYVLYTRVMDHSPSQPDWPDRDRFVLSCGHASMLLYSTLYLTGYGLTLDDLKNFRQLGSPTAGHPEYGHAAGHRDHDRPARPGHLDRRRHGARRAHAGRALQPRGPRDRRPLHVRDRLRRRPAGGRRLRGLLARRPPRPRQADLVLGRQPHLDRGRHRALLHRGRRRALRGLRLARPEPRRGHRRSTASRRRWPTRARSPTSRA